VVDVTVLLNPFGPLTTMCRLTLAGAVTVTERDPVAGAVEGELEQPTTSSRRTSLFITLNEFESAATT
jgi:hypothetical protein